jgi:hypothetical protein
MATYDELEEFASAGLFHNDPTEAHSASSQMDVDCALATAVNNVRTTRAGIIVRWKTETKVFIAPPRFLDPLEGVGLKKSGIDAVSAINRAARPKGLKKFRVHVISALAAAGLPPDEHMTHSSLARRFDSRPQQTVQTVCRRRRSFCRPNRAKESALSVIQ